MEGSRDEAMRQTLIADIECMEWDMFSSVNNIGGKADCQNDRDQFSVMREASYATWTSEMLESYKDDLEQAASQGVNLMSEKYARMMEVTMPGAIDMPPLPDARRALMDEAMGIVMSWEEELYERYALLRHRARSLTQASEDGSAISGTAFDTYLYGELSIYSERTLRLYVEHLRMQRAAGTNGSMAVYDRMARLQGWASFDAADKDFRKRMTEENHAG